MAVREFTTKYNELTLAVIAFLGGVILSAYVQRELLLLHGSSRVEISDGSVHALYNFEDNARDAAGHAYNGTFNASLTAGKFGQGAQFDGTTEYITLPHGATVWGDSDWSISVWVKFAAPINGQTIIADDDGGGSHPKWIFSYGDELPGHLTLTEDWGGHYVDLGAYTPARHDCLPQLHPDLPCSDQGLQSL